MFTLYQYTNVVNGKRYIGVTKDVVERRRRHLQGTGRALALSAAIKKYGVAAFSFAVLAVFDDANAAAYHEQASIIKLGTLSPGGYNLMAGAPRTIYHGAHTPETLAKISSSNKGLKRTAETRARISAVKTGRKHTAESRANMGASRKGKKFSAEHCARIGAAKLGFKHTPESRMKMSTWQQGRKLSTETRAKMRASQIAAWEKRRVG